MNIYISGKITGLPLDEARGRFSKISDLIIIMGYTPRNPMELVPCNPEWSWEDYIKEDIGILLKCEGIFLLNNWQESKGARIEYAVAKELGLQVFIEK